MSDYILNLGLSRCTRLHYCFVSSVIVQKNQVFIWCTQECGVFWLLLKVCMRLPSYNLLANLYHGSLLSNVGHFRTLIVLHYPICEGDFVYSMKVG